MATKTKQPKPIAPASPREPALLQATRDWLAGRDEPTTLGYISVDVTAPSLPLQRVHPVATRKER